MTRFALAVFLLLLAGHGRATVNGTTAVKDNVTKDNATKDNAAKKNGSISSAAKENDIEDGESTTAMTDKADEPAGTENSSAGDKLLVGLSPEGRHTVEAGLEAPQQWGIGGVLAMSGLVCFCGVMPLCCFGLSFSDHNSDEDEEGQFDQTIAQTVCLRPPVLRPIQYDTEGHAPPEKERFSLVRRALYGEMLLSIMQPFVLAIIWLGLSTLFADGEVPSWVQAVVVSLPMLRVCLVEASLAASVQSLLKEDLGETSVLTKPFLLSKLDVADASPDGTSIAVVILLGRFSLVIRQRLLAAWGGGATGRVLASAVLHCNLSGLMVSALVGASLVQIGLSYADSRRKVTADIAGMGRLAQWLTVHDRHADECRAAFKRIDKVSFEVSPQPFLQSSAVLAAGDGLLAQPELLASMTITSGLMLKQCTETVDAVWRVGKNSAGCLAFLPACMMPLCVVAVQLRLGAAEMCGGSHLFDVSSWRCVPGPLPQQ